MRNHRSGFTLLELGITLIVISLLIGGVLTVVTQHIRQQKYAELKMKMDVIEEALIAFSKGNSRIPCPASATLPVSDAAFGLENGTGVSGNCGSHGYPGIGTDGAKLYYGAVPVKTLGLPDEILFDPWGGRFTYAVDQTLIVFSDAAAYPGPALQDLGSIAIHDTAGNPKTTGVLAMVLSHGPNGHGAYQVSGARKVTGSANSSEQANCMCDADGNDMANSSIFVQGAGTSDSGSPLNSFDDIARFYKRSNFLLAADILTEKPY